MSGQPAFYLCTTIIRSWEGDKYDKDWEEQISGIVIGYDVFDWGHGWVRQPGHRT